jgi:3-hydroxy-9,10-secoandrosta-1,3,5(10)-triene-9,17-dione monooxygenase reductase component
VVSRIEEAVDGMRMRDVLGRFCSGVTVVTAVSKGQPVGFTCQSFFSLSLTPPLIAFSPSRSSTTWPKVRDEMQFGINILSATHAHVSDAFGRTGVDKFAGLIWKSSGLGNPILDGVVALIDAQLWAEYDGGDHTLVAARVLDLEIGTDSEPLIFHRGSYGRIGSESAPHSKPHAVDRSRT